MNNLSKIGQSALFLVAVGLMVLILFRVSNPSYLDDAKKQIKKIDISQDSIKNQLKFVQEQIFQMDLKQGELSDKVKEGNMKIDVNNKEILKLRKIYNEKINNTVDHLSISQLDSFFAERYKRFYEK